jgi:hypothetical protein
MSESATYNYALRREEPKRSLVLLSFNPVVVNELHETSFMKFWIFSSAHCRSTTQVHYMYIGTEEAVLLSLEE